MEDNNSERKQKIRKMVKLGMKCVWLWWICWFRMPCALSSLLTSCNSCGIIFALMRCVFNYGSGRTPFSS